MMSMITCMCCSFTAVRLVCNFRTLAGGVVLVGSGLALRSCTSFEEYSDAFNKVIVPAFTKLVELSEGSSLCFTVQAETPSALNELWSIYKNGTLKHLLQEFLVREEIKQLASGEDVEVTVCVDEQEYREAYLDLMLQQNQGEAKQKSSACVFGYLPGTVFPTSRQRSSSVCVVGCVSSL